MTELRLFLILGSELRSWRLLLSVVLVILLLICILCPCFNRSSLCSWIIFSILWAIWGSMTWLMASITNYFTIIRKLIFIWKSLRSCCIILSCFVVELKELRILAKCIELLLIFIKITIVRLILIVFIFKVIAVVIVVRIWEWSLDISIGYLIDFLEFDTCFNQTLIATWMETN